MSLTPAEQRELNELRRLKEQAQMPVAPKPREMSALDVAGSALYNLPSSTYELGKSTVQALTSPIETGRAIVNLGSSVLGKLGITDASPEMADQVGKFYKDRYGSIENAKRTFAKDPAGFLADASTILTGVGGAVRAIPKAVGGTGGAVGQAGRAIQRAAQIVDPLSIAGSTVRGAGKVAAAIPGFTSGAGTRAVEEAVKAGYRGGEAGEAFVSQMRPSGASAVSDVVETVKPAIASLKADRSAAYMNKASKSK